MILIGSKAFECHGIHLPRPEGYVSDIDLIMDEMEFTDCRATGLFVSWETLRSNKAFAYDRNQQKYEIELVKYISPFSPQEDTTSCKSSVLLHRLKCTHRTVLHAALCGVPPKEILFAIKKSHITFPVNWFKNIEDYHYLKANYFKDFDLKTDKDAFKVYAYRKQEANQRIKTKINLNLKNEDFFNQYEIDRLVDHDLLHEMVAIYDKPMHTRIRKDPESAYCNQDLWNHLSIDEQLATVREEAAVIALERAILPKLIKKLPVDYIAAYRWAVMRICTTLTKGWFQEFAIEHWPVLKYFKHTQRLDWIAEKALQFC